MSVFDELDDMVAQAKARASDTVELDAGHYDRITMRDAPHGVFASRQIVDGIVSGSESEQLWHWFEYEGVTFWRGSSPPR